MPIRLVFRCDYCDARPDPDTQRTLEGQLLDRQLRRVSGCAAGDWLIFNAGGPLGGRRYACIAHRTHLTADLDAHYGAMCPLVRDAGPYPSLGPTGSAVSTSVSSPNCCGADCAAAEGRA